MDCREFQRLYGIYPPCTRAEFVECFRHHEQCGECQKWVILRHEATLAALDERGRNELESVATEIGDQFSRELWSDPETAEELSRILSTRTEGTDAGSETET